MKTFYDREFSQDKYAVNISDHRYHPILGAFVEQYQLENSLVLEVGCGRGAFQDLVTHYVGVDLSERVARYLRKPFVPHPVSWTQVFIKPLERERLGRATGPWPAKGF